MMLASKRYGHDIWPAPSLWYRNQGIFELASGVCDPENLLENSGNPKQSSVPEFKWTVGEFAKAVLNGVSQVTFVENWKTGICWVVGLTLSFELVGNSIYTNAFTAGWNPFSPLYLAGAMALIGSVIGVTLAIFTKLPIPEIRGGIHGFNQVLVMIALTGFLPLTWQTFLYAVLATIVCSLFTMPALQNFFGRWGLPALTGPFVFTTWFFLLAAPYALNVPFGIGWGRP
jgi:urea transporter